MTKTQHQKLEVPFHRLTEEEIRQWYQDKLLTTAGYLLAIKRVTRPPGVEFVIPNVIKFCKEWGISKSAFYRAVDELKQKGYTNWEATHGIVIKESRKIISFPSEKKYPTSGKIEAGNTHNAKLPALLRLLRFIQTLYRLSQKARERILRNL